MMSFDDREDLLNILQGTKDLKIIESSFESVTVSFLFTATSTAPEMI